MESFYRRQEKQLKEKLSIAFVLAQSIAERVGMYLNKDNKARAPWDFYPGLFTEEKAAYEKAAEEAEMEERREKIRAYAAGKAAEREALYCFRAGSEHSGAGWNVSQQGQ